MKLASEEVINQTLRPKQEFTETTLLLVATYSQVITTTRRYERLRRLRDRTDSALLNIT